VAIKSEQSRDIGNIVCTGRRQTKHKNTTHKTKTVSNTVSTKRLGWIWTDIIRAWLSVIQQIYHSHQNVKHMQNSQNKSSPRSYSVILCMLR